MSRRKRRTERLSVVMSKEEAEVITVLAERRGLAKAQYLRQLVAEDGHRVLQEQRSRLSENG